ncbi:MAG: hypothetical protein HY343_01205 [Lentisphaerae bacterium]|nr:hypothetical protein [Lentisphaerota bacterium]
MSEKTQSLVRMIRSETPEGARVLFAGPTVHFYGNHGHVAVLPALTGREMMACDYYHFPPKSVEYNYPPAVFRKKGDERIFEFMDFYNVSLIITYHPEWMAALRGSPDYYEEIAGAMEDAAVFRVLRGNSLFLKGEGRVRADFNRLDVSLPRLQDDVVLKYNWFKSMRASPPVELFPVEIEKGYNLIGVRPHGVKDFSIRF